MAFLIIAGITVPVAEGEATKRATERVGSTTRMFSGALRSTVRVEKRSWQVTTKLLPLATAATLEAAVADGVFVACSGDMIGTTLDCEVVVGESPYRQTPSGAKRSMQLTIREV